MIWFVIYAVVAFVGLVWRWWEDDEYPAWQTGGDIAAIAFWPFTLVMLAVVFLVTFANEWRDATRQKLRVRKAAGAAPQGDPK